MKRLVVVDGERFEVESCRDFLRGGRERVCRREDCKFKKEVPSVCTYVWARVCVCTREKERRVER